MNNHHLVSLLLIFTLASCSSNTILPPTITNSVTPNNEILPTSTNASIPKPSTTIAPPLSQTPFSTLIPNAFESLVSPNGELVANAYFQSENSSEIPTIEIRSKEGNILWQIPYKGEPPISYPRPLLTILRWSNDSSQLYFYYAWSPDGGDRAFWWTGYDLQKIDVKTGDINYLLPGEGFMSFKISPDGTQIAYTRSQDNPSSIYIRNLSTDSEKAAYVLSGSLKYERVGDIQWSPDGKKLVFQTETKDYGVQTILLNPFTLEQRVIREYLLTTLWFDGWTDNVKLQFSKTSPDGMRIMEVFQIDITTNEMLVIGTPTPRP